MKPLWVKLDRLRYPLEIASGSLAFIGQRVKDVIHDGKIMIITDENVWKYHGSTLEQSLVQAGVPFKKLILPPGEGTKTTDSLLACYAAMAKEGINRADAVLAFGGGVIGDLAGLAAATYLRGICLIQVPTTLLSQVDSSIGGKVAVDLPQGKNLVGTFYHPHFVLIDPDVLSTLPDHEFACGMAEVIKYGCIADARLFQTILRHPGRKQMKKVLPSVIASCCRIKRNVVQQDEMDTGLRMILNFGHTLGHAIEKAGGFEVFLHGQAVAIGMVKMALYGEQIGITQSGTAAQIASICRSFSLETAMPALPKQDLLHAMGHDKKVRGSGIKVVLLDEIGKCRLHAMPVGDLEELV